MPSLPDFNACFLGASLGTGNRGVSALAASLVKLTLEARPEAQIKLLISHRNSDPFVLKFNGTARHIGVVNCRLSPRSRPSQHLLWILFAAALYRLLPLAAIRRWLSNCTPWIQATEQASLLGDIRGGDSFSDIYGLREFLLGSLPVLACLLVRSRLVLLPQTYGPYNSPIARRIARAILRRAFVILSRDRESLATVRQLVGHGAPVRFCPDVAFSLEAVVPPRPEIDPPLENLPGKSGLIGINVNGLMYNGGYTRANAFGLRLDYREFLTCLLRELLAVTSGHILFVPHTLAPSGSVESDPAACREVIRSAPPEHAPRVHLVTGDYDQHELKGLIGLCDFFIGSRMHSCIAALSQGIPTAGVAYSKKFHGVFDSVGVADWVIDGRETETRDAVARVLALWHQRRQMRGHLHGKITQAQATLQATFQALVRGQSPPAAVSTPGAVARAEV